MLKLDLAALRPWLQQHLEPICDADPAVLSEYIVALLKHDVSIDELKKLCQEQLEDFLGQETAPFITKLFFYLTTPPSLASLRAEPPRGPRGLKRTSDSGVGLTSAPSAKRGAPTLNGAAEAQLRTVPPISLPQYPAQPSQIMHQSPARRADIPTRELCKDYHYRGFCARGAGCPFLHDDGPSLTVPPSFFAPFPPMPPYAPSHHPHQVPPHAMSPHPRSLPPGAGPLPRRGPGAGPNAGNDGRPLSTTTLAIENIPREALTSANIRQFFEKFGTVASVAVDAPGLRALVAFATPEEAKRALSSPEAVFGNRFVRVYRAREAVAGTLGGGQEVQPNVRPQSSPAVPFTSISPSQSSLSPSAATTTTSLLPTRSSNAVKESRVASERASQLQDNAAAQKSLMQQLDQLPSSNSAERKKIMSSLRQLGREAQVLVEASSVAPFSSESPLKPEEQLALLQKEAASLGIDAHPPRRFPTRGRGSARRHRGGYVSRGRGGSSQSFRLDNRATKIVVGNVNETTALPVLRSYFERFGEVLLLNPTSDSTEHVVEFKTRQSAEDALAQGSDIPAVGRVTLRWATAESSKPTSPAQSRLAGTDVAMADQGRSGAGEVYDESAPRPTERSARDDEEDTERSWNH